MRTDFFGKANKAKTAIFMHRCPGRDWIRHPAFGFYIRKGGFPTFANTNIETFIDQFNLRPHDAAHQDVANPVINRVVKWHPAFLNQTALHADLRSNRGNLPCVVGLHTTNRHQRIGTRFDRIRHDIFHLTDLVTAKSQTGIAIFALGIQCNIAAKMFGQTRQRFNRRRAKGQRVFFKLVQIHRALPENGLEPCSG